VNSNGSPEPDVLLFLITRFPHQKRSFQMKIPRAAPEFFARLSRLFMVMGFFLVLVPAAAGDAVEVTVLQSDDPVVIDYEFNPYGQETVIIDHKEYLALSLGGERPYCEKGLPSLPRVCRSVIIPSNVEVEINVLDYTYHEIKADIVPSKGHIKRTVDPATVPYTFGDFYETDAWFPAEAASLDTPYIMRDTRGVVVTVNPFSYNPAKGAVKVFTRIVVEVVEVGRGKVNTLTVSARKPCKSFYNIFKNHFVNFNTGRYAPLDEDGDLLIITHDSFNTSVRPLKTWKDSIGIATTIVDVSTIGNNSNSIKNYIQNVYDTSNLAFVLLVGDSTQVATPKPSGYFAEDPTYALLAGSDSYPEIMVGRFSAETVAEVDTQVERTIEYERGDHEGGWFWKGTGVGSAEGAGQGHNGESDKQHIDLIRDDLIANDYTSVDQIYDPGATASMVSSALNDGRGIVNYCGHGDWDSWGTTGFSNSHVNGLTNANQLPFIVSVACINGYFSGVTCFAETWLRATHNNEPSGAIGMYASSQFMDWAPPMDAQDEIVDRYLDGTYQTFGALCFAGSCKMMDLNGPGADIEFKRWHVFGDPSLNVHPGGGPDNPSPDIKVNGQDGPLSLQQGTTLNVTVSLDPGDQAGVAHDWWIHVVMDSNYKFWWLFPGNWVLSATPKRAYGGALVSLSDYAIASGTVPVGQWDFYFCVDALNNTYEGTYEDTVQVQVY